MKSIERQMLELTASVVIWAVPVSCALLLLLRKARLDRYLRRKHPEAWRSLGGGRYFADQSRFGAFLFDGEEDLEDGELRAMKSGVRTMLLAALVSSVAALVLNYLSDRYLAGLLGL